MGNICKRCNHKDTQWVQNIYELDLDQDFYNSCFIVEYPLYEFIEGEKAIAVCQKLYKQKIGFFTMRTYNPLIISYSNFIEFDEAFKLKKSIGISIGFQYAVQSENILLKAILEDISNKNIKN